MLDVLYVSTTLALFALVGLIGRGVAKLGPRARSSAQPEATIGEEPR